MVLPAVAFLVGEEYTVVAKKEEAVCTIKRFSVKNGQDVRQCSLNVADVLKSLADIHGRWTDAVDLLRKADASRRLSRELRFDALPPPPPSPQRAKAATDATSLRTPLATLPA